jgi:hypothetical protein
MTTSTHGGLSDARRRLVRLMQQIRFGKVEGLRVRGGEPVFSPPPVVTREHKFGGENGPHPGAEAADFRLKAQIQDLCAALDALGDGTIAVIDVRHGLPFRMLVPEPVRLD